MCSQRRFCGFRKGLEQKPRVLCETSDFKLRTMLATLKVSKNSENSVNLQINVASICQESVRPLAK